MAVPPWFAGKLTRDTFAPHPPPGTSVDGFTGVSASLDIR
jgi:hypothetical protein